MALPAYLEDTAKDFAKQSVATYSAPIETSTFTGGLDASGKRAAGPGITGLNPFVAAMDPLQTQAQTLAQQGIGSYTPFLQEAQKNISAQAGLTGPDAYKDFMSPFQQQIIDTSLADFDTSRIADRRNIQEAAIKTGNFGGGREGAMLGQYDADTALGRAGLLAGLQQQGFTQAQNLAQQAFANQGTLAQNQFGLSNFERTGMGQDIGALGNLGALNQQQAQANLLANQQAAKTAAYEPYGRLQQYGSGLTGLAGGVASAYAEPAPVQSPLSQALSTALGVGGIYSRLYGGQ
tara:strand:+ start:141 stop:1016 length:876 start_codon:yes stop_codon:yes gene_type:complete